MRAVGERIAELKFAESCQRQIEAAELQFAELEVEEFAIPARVQEAKTKGLTIKPAFPAAADVPGNPVADRPASGAACPGMRSAGGQMRQTTTSEVRLESRPKARGCRQLDFIIYLEDMKRLQIIHLEDMRGVTDAVTCGLNTRKPVH